MDDLKFIQIISSDINYGSVLGLTAEGSVYFMDDAEDGWEKIPMKVKEVPAKKPEKISWFSKK